MQIYSLQGQTLPTPVFLESALLELLEISSSALIEGAEAQVSTDYSNSVLTAAVTLPIQQHALPSGVVVIEAIHGTIPDPPLG